MKTTTIVRWAVALFLMIAIGANLNAQTMKAAFVNSNIILRELPEAQKASREIEATVKMWQDSLERMSQDLQAQVAEYQKKREYMSQPARDNEERRLAELQQRAREYQMLKFDTRQGEAVALNEKKLAPIQDKIIRVIEQVAKEMKFTYVFDRAAGNVVLYAEPQFDLTYKVIDRLKRGQ